MDKLAEWKEWIALLDAMIKPIANRPIDITDPNWLTKLQSSPNPLEAAGVKAETEKLLSELIEYYPSCDDKTREAIRKLFAENRSFSWAAALPYRPITDKSFRAHLILFSIKDQGRDTRDAILALQSMCARATSAGRDRTNPEGDRRAIQRCEQVRNGLDPVSFVACSTCLYRVRVYLTHGENTQN